MDDEEEEGNEVLEKSDGNDKDVEQTKDVDDSQQVEDNLPKSSEAVTKPPPPAKPKVSSVKTISYKLDLCVNDCFLEASSAEEDYRRVEPRIRG